MLETAKNTCDQYPIDERMAADRKEFRKKQISLEMLLIIFGSSLIESSTVISTLLL